MNGCVIIYKMVLIMMKNMGIKGSANRQSVFIYQYGSMMAGLKILEFFVEIISENLNKSVYKNDLNL